MKKALTIMAATVSLALGGCVTTGHGHYGGYGQPVRIGKGYGYGFHQNYGVSSCNPSYNNSSCNSVHRYHSAPRVIEQRHPYPSRQSHPQPIRQSSRQFNNPTASRRR